MIIEEDKSSSLDEVFIGSRIWKQNVEKGLLVKAVRDYIESEEFVRDNPP